MPKRTPLVCQHLENISRGVLEQHQEIVRKYVRHRQGVDALYRRGKLYYMGLASNLRGRLAHHLKDRHHKLGVDLVGVVRSHIRGRVVEQAQHHVVVDSDEPTDGVKLVSAETQALLHRDFGTGPLPAAMADLEMLVGGRIQHTLFSSHAFGPGPPQSGRTRITGGRRPSNLSTRTR